MVLAKYSQLPKQPGRCFIAGCNKSSPGLRAAPKDPELPLRYQPDRMCTNHLTVNAKVHSVLCLLTLADTFDPVLMHDIRLSMSKYINHAGTGRYKN
jgi:hypothetical protein